ncbi:hypothetical protein OR16_41249 [Cupriavidus basilensis OR16]|uniref:Uncharacterized protein n=1 Tax=Cupriavidus basilensis OR16 TaxID=1127483 RepID=H1SIC9_9BURK|nr:hypothetical protein OR16_41249 [Cupriavidus basilensis OR16]
MIINDQYTILLARDIFLYCSLEGPGNPTIIKLLTCSHWLILTNMTTASPPQKVDREFRGQIRLQLIRHMRALLPQLY